MISVGVENRKANHRRIVVVVEDDRPIGELLAAIINDEDGYLAIHLTRPSEALHTLSRIRPDLIVLDVGLPGMSGLELYDRIRVDERLRGVPVMFETAVARDYRGEFTRRGITAVMAKPFDVGDFVRRVHELAPLN